LGSVVGFWVFFKSSPFALRVSWQGLAASGLPRPGGRRDCAAWRPAGLPHRINGICRPARGAGNYRLFKEALDRPAWQMILREWLPAAAGLPADAPWKKLSATILKRQAASSKREAQCAKRKAQSRRPCMPQNPLAPKSPGLKNPWPSKSPGLKIPYASKPPGPQKSPGLKTPWPQNPLAPGGAPAPPTGRAGWAAGCGSRCRAAQGPS
jgi:hypothetical protein